MCACGGDTDGNCIERHSHHVGNDRADRLAESGKWLMPGQVRGAPLGGNFEVGYEKEWSMRGEELWWVRNDEGHHIQGAIRQALVAQATSTREQEMRQGTSRRGREWMEAQDTGHAGVRSHVAKNTQKHRRFRIRAWGGSLPTYSSEHRKARSGNNMYTHVYTAGGKWGVSECMGQCICCRDGREETTEHMCTCAGREAALAATLRRVDAVWKEARMANEWHACDWVRRPEEGGDRVPRVEELVGPHGVGPEGVSERTGTPHYEGQTSGQAS